MSSACFTEQRAVNPEITAPGCAQPAERSNALIWLVFGGIHQSGRHFAPVFYRCDVISPYLFNHLSSSVTLHPGCQPDDLIGRPRASLECSGWVEDAPLLERLPRLFSLGVHVGECRLHHRDGLVPRFRDEMRLLIDQDSVSLQIVGCLTAMEDRHDGSRIPDPLRHFAANVAGYPDGPYPSSRALWRRCQRRHGRSGPGRSRRQE